LLAEMWEWTLRRASKAGPVSRGQSAWQVLVFLLWALVLEALIWWYLQGQE